MDKQPPSDIAVHKAQSPVQPLLCFPKRQIGTNGRPRAFNHSWYSSYPWIEYSVGKDAAFCFACRFFTLGNRKEDAFTHVGFRDWKHAIGTRGIISRHNSSSLHKAAMSGWNSYQINCKTSSNVANQLQKSRLELVQSNRYYIKSLCKVILLCAKQDLALRGHRESSDSQNQGNFLEILKLISDHDEVIHQKLQNLPGNATYTSPEMQNTLLKVMGSIVRDQICRKLRNASMYSILVDETKDLSKNEQVAIAFRYVDVSSATIYERFLTYVHAEKLDAESLVKHILDTLALYQLDPTFIISQVYDGASVMSGCLSGVQTRLKQHAPNAIYIHCNAHCLNLCLVDSTKAVKEAREFFGLLEGLYVFLSSSKCHVLFVENQKRLYPDKQIRYLQRLSDTRWACRANAVATICYSYNAVVETLSQFIDENDNGNRVCEAKGLLLQIKTFMFIVSLVVFDRVLSVTKGLSDALQSTDIDLAKAASLVCSTIETIEIFRSDSEWDKVFSYAERIASHHNITIACQMSSRAQSRRLPSRFSSDVVMSTTGARENTARTASKTSFYYPVLDALLFELRRRFDKKNQDIMIALQACNPSSDSFLDVTVMKPLIDAYQLDHTILEV